MGAEQVLDEVVTSANLEALLLRYADNLPGDYKPDSHSWGGVAATELLQRLRGTPLEAEANRIFERFMTSGSDDQARLAQNYVSPTLVSVAELERAMGRADLAADVQRGILTALARALAAQPNEFRARHRALLSRPGSDALVGAILVSDHAWFLTHITEVLGADADSASNRLWYGLQALNGAEAKRLRDEVDGRRAQLGDAYVRALVDTIDGEAQDFAARPGAVRWPAVGAIP